MQEVFTETAARVDLVKEMFSGWRCRDGEREMKVYGNFTHPDKLKDLTRIRREDERAAAMLLELKEAMDQLNAYRATLTERYGIIATAPTVPVVKLTRRRNFYDKLVYFDLVTARRILSDGTDVEETRKTYPGRERKQAIADYREYVKAHPGIIAEMDIEKSRWER